MDRADRETRRGSGPRRRLAVVCLLVAVLVAGCGSGGAPPAVVSGSPATVAPGAVTEAGYESAGTANRTVNTTVTLSLSGDVELRASREVSATVPVARYARTTETGTARVAVLAVPLVRPVPDRQERLSPVDATPRRLVAFLGPDAPAVDGDSLSRVGTRTVSLLGVEASLETHAGRTAAGDRVRVAVVTVRHGGDAVSVVALHPADASGTRDRLDRLLAGVVHEADGGSSQG